MVKMFPLISPPPVKQRGVFNPEELWNFPTDSWFVFHPGRTSYLCHIPTVKIISRPRSSCSRSFKRLNRQTGMKECTSSCWCVHFNQRRCRTFWKICSTTARWLTGHWFWYITAMTTDWNTFSWHSKWTIRVIAAPGWAVLLIITKRQSKGRASCSSFTARLNSILSSLYLMQGHHALRGQGRLWVQEEVGA